MRTGLNHVRAADRPAPSSARVRATSRSNLRSAADQAPALDSSPPHVQDGKALDDDVTDIVVVARAGLALVRVQEPSNDDVDKLRGEPAGHGSPSRRTKKTSKSPASAA